MIREFMFLGGVSIKGSIACQGFDIRIMW